MTRIILKFIYAATADLSKGIDFFEREKVQVHLARAKMEDLLLCQLRKCVSEVEFEDLDDEANTVSRKTGYDLLEVEVTSDTLLKNKKIFVGQGVEKEIKALGLSPTSPQISWLYEVVRQFHKTVVTFLKKYFDTPLKSSTMDNMSALAPGRNSHILTSRKITALAKKYSKVVTNIQPVGGMDQLKEEIGRYTVDEEVGMLEEGDYEEYWSAISEFKEGSGDWEKFTVLPRFAMAMAVKFNDTSSVERKFSSMNYIHQNKQRNCMSQGMLDAQLHIQSGVESKESIQGCHKCSEGASPHCHCKDVKVTAEIREKCKAAWRKCREAEEKSQEEKKEESNEMKLKREDIESKEEERVKKLKEDLQTKETFYNKSLMLKKVYGKEKDESKNQEKQAVKDSKQPIDKEKQGTKRKLGEGSDSSKKQSGSKKHLNISTFKKK